MGKVFVIGLNDWIPGWTDGLGFSGITTVPHYIGGTSI